MSDPTASVSDIYQLAQEYQRQGDLGQARARLMEVLQLQPDHADALHSLGNIDAREGHLDDAERLVRRAIALDPLKAVFLNSLGNLLKARGRLKEATSVYEQVVRLRPDLAAGYNNLAEMRLRSGDNEGAVDRCFEALKVDPNYAGAYDTMGRAFNNLGRLDEAIDAFRRAVIVRPDYAVAYDHLGHVFRSQGNMAEARDAFEHALLIDPENASARYNLGTVLIVQGDLDGGIECFEQARDARPRHIPTLLNLGIAYHTRGQLKLAAETYRRAIELDASNPLLHLNLGLVRVEQRRTEEAEKSLLRALELDPRVARPYAELAALYEETNRLEDMEAVLRRGLEMAPEDPRLRLEAAKADRRAGRIQEGIDRLSSLDPDAMDPRLAEQVRYQLGYLYDRADQADEAMKNFREANRLASETVRAQQSRPNRYLNMLDRLATYFSSADTEAWTPTSFSAPPAPVFMIGFPRSGTTLLDLAMDSHPGILTVEEKPTIVPVLEALKDSAKGFPEGLEELGQDEIVALRAAYREALAKFVPGDFDGLVVDKMPIRTVHVGIIWRLFPDARFLFCLRHPCDVVLSNFMQHYTVSDAFANFFTLEDAVKTYDRVMKLWQIYTTRLPINYHTVRYESLVEDMASELRGVLEFLDVPWDSGVLDYAERARDRGRINTNSYHQVTEPLYTRSSGRWRRYAHHLEPYVDLLAPHVQRFGYEM